MRPGTALIGIVTGALALHVTGIPAPVPSDYRGIRLLGEYEDLVRPARQEAVWEVIDGELLSGPLDLEYIRFRSADPKDTTPFDRDIDARIVAMEFDGFKQKLRGYIDGSGNIVLDSALAPDQLRKVLHHEMKHLKMNRIDDPRFESEWNSCNNGAYVGIFWGWFTDEQAQRLGYVDAYAMRSLSEDVAQTGQIAETDPAYLDTLARNDRIRCKAALLAEYGLARPISPRLLP